MEWLVCKNKKDGDLFMQSRIEREYMLNVLMDVEQEICSIVVKQFLTVDEADDYLFEITQADKLINSIIK